MRRILATQALLMAMVAPVLAASQTAPASPLDGTAWTIHVTPDEAAARKGEKPFDDVMMFNSGRVAMSECLKHGFKASKYTAEKSGEDWTVTAEQTSESAGKASWNMGISGDSMKGTLVSTKPDGTVLHYAFEGKRAGK